MEISVVIPTYNREKTIIRCLESVMRQTYQPLEVLVVDDGSTDDTLRKVNEIKNDSVRILKQIHRGAQAARNYGIKEASGEYVAFLDSDDEWLPEKLELQAKALSGNPDSIVTCNGYYQNDEDEQPLLQRKAFVAGSGNGCVYPRALRGSSSLFQGIVCSKKALQEIGLLDENVPAFQEWDTTIRLAKNNSFCHVKKPLFVYHFHDGETISKDALKDAQGRLFIVEKFASEIAKECGKIALNKMRADVLRRWIVQDYNKYVELIEKWGADSDAELLNDLISDFETSQNRKKKLKAVLESEKGKEDISRRIMGGGYNSIAIYGMGDLGVLLYKEIDKSSINVMYGIDKRADVLPIDIPLFFPEDTLQQVDAVIICAIDGKDAIEQSLRKKLSCPMIVLENLIMP